MCSSNTFHFFTIFKLAGDCLWNFDGFYITHLSKNGNIQKQEFLWLTFSLYRGLYKVSYSAWGVYIIQRIWPVHTNKKPWREPSIPFLQIHLCQQDNLVNIWLMFNGAIDNLAVKPFIRHKSLLQWICCQHLGWQHRYS